MRENSKINGLFFSLLFSVLMLWDLSKRNH